MSKLIFAALVLLINCAAADATGKRVALVIGNAHYDRVTPLKNTLNDANAISASLKSVGFEVIDGRDLSQQALGEALSRFAKLARDADAALFYFAGHGVQVGGQNYIIPTDARLEDEFSLPFQTTRIEDVISALNYSSGVKILVLDACRDNPFAMQLAKGGTRGGIARGLAPIPRTEGMLVAYATQANAVASDGENDGRNSPFAEALSKEIRKPGLEVAALFRNVQNAVHEKTGGKQTPELSISIIGNFFLNAGENDSAAWKKIMASHDPREIEDFIAKYPESEWLSAARIRLKEIEQYDTLAQQVAEQERLVGAFAERETTLRAQALKAQIELRLAMEKLAKARNTQPPDAEKKRTQAAQEGNELEHKVSPSERPSPRHDEKSRLDALAEQVAQQKEKVLTLAQEKARIERERQASEKALADRVRQRELLRETVAHSKAGELNNNKATFETGPAQQQPVSAAVENPSALECRQLLSRMQMGQEMDGDRDLLKRCRP